MAEEAVRAMAEEAARAIAEEAARLEEEAALMAEVARRTLPVATAVDYEEGPAYDYRGGGAAGLSEDAAGGVDDAGFPTNVEAGRDGEEEVVDNGRLRRPWRAAATPDLNNDAIAHAAGVNDGGAFEIDNFRSDFDPQARERRLLRERVAAEQQEAEAWRVETQAMAEARREALAAARGRAEQNGAAPSPAPEQQQHGAKPRGTPSTAPCPWDEVDDELLDELLRAAR